MPSDSTTPEPAGTNSVRDPAVEIRPSGRAIAVRGLMVAVLLMAGCAATPDECDPSQVGNVVKAAGCAWGGGYAARQADLAHEVETRVAAYRLSQEEVARLKAEARRLGGDQEAWRGRLAAMNSESARLRLELNASRTSSERSRARVDALRREARNLQSRLDQANAASSATVAEIQALTLEVERRQQAIRELLQETEVE